MKFYIAKEDINKLGNTTKEDINRLEKLILQNQVEIEKRFTTTIITIVTTIIAVVGIATAILKL